MAGGMCGRGAYLSEGACMAGGHVWQILRDTVNEGRYASYWNAFLLSLTLVSWSIVDLQSPVMPFGKKTFKKFKT